jgi:hypothetical protein
MKRPIVIFFSLVFAFACDTASNIKPPGRSYFVKYFGGDGNQTAVKLIVNSDGTFFILGNTRKAAGDLQKIYLSKADAQGTLIWERTYGSVEMQAKDFVVTGGTLVVAANRIIAGSTQIQLIQFSLDSVLLKSTVLQLPSSSSYVNSITVLNDGDILVSGNTDYVTSGFVHSQNGLHLRTDGNLVPRSWPPIDGSGEINNVVKGFQPPSDSIYFFGSTNASPGNATDQNFWTFRLLSSTGAQNGNSDDNSEYILGINLSDEIVTDAIKASFGGYLITGISTNINSQIQSLRILKLRFDDLTFKLDPNNLDVGSIYVKELGKGNTPFATACNSNTGFLVLANFYNSSGLSDMILLKLDQGLSEIGDSVMLGGDGNDMAAAVAELPDGHIMILGTMNLGKPAEQNKIVLMKLNSQGKLTD